MEAGLEAFIQKDWFPWATPGKPCESDVVMLFCTVRCCNVVRMENFFFNGGFFENSLGKPRQAFVGKFFKNITF